MKKWRKTISLVFLSVGLVALTPNVANAQSCNPCCDPCDWNLCDQTFLIGADFLYWKPCIDDLDYAAVVENDNGFTDVDYKGICPDWQPGFRGYFGLPEFFCDWGLYFSYTRLECCDTHKTTFDDPDGSNGITSPLIHPDLLTTNLYDEAKGHWDLTYQEWDVLFSYDISCNCCHSFSPFFGVAGVYIEQHLRAEFPNDWEVDWHSDYWGVGLRAGSEYAYRFNDCFSFFARASGTLLAGKADSRNRQEFGTDIEIKDDDCCHFVPGYHIGAGFVYEGCTCGTEWGIRIGYEFLNWHNVPNHRVFSGTDGDNAELSHSSSASTRNLGFHGLLAGVSLSF